MTNFKLIPLLLTLLLAACAQEEIPTSPTATSKPVPTFLPGTADWWQPRVDASFHIQYVDEIDLSLDMDVYNLDLFETSEAVITTLHERGVRVVCYFSAGSFEDWRPDVDAFPEAVIGEPLDGWEGEAWLDIREISGLTPVMTSRLDLAAAKGCDGVDPDNVNAYTQDSGFPLTAEDQLAYNRWIAEEAHARGLAVGLKNDLEQIPALVDAFDFAVNEECFQYTECDLVLPFIQQGKPVFSIEYEGAPEEFCPQTEQMGLQTVYKNLELDAFQVNCWDY